MPTHPLERLLAPIDAPPVADGSIAPRGNATARIRCRSGVGAPEWLHADGWKLYAVPGAKRTRGGSVLATLRTEAGETLHIEHAPNGSGVDVPFSLAEAYENYVTERWAQGARQRRLPAAALSAFYRVKGAIPRAAQLTARRMLIRWQRLSDFPQWPFDASVSRLLALYARCGLEACAVDELAFHWFWPDRNRAALILTHDVESAPGLRNALAIADIEEEHGMRSSFNIVGSWYAIDWGIVEELDARGFELGVHGIFHDRSLFSSRKEFERQQPLLVDMRKRLGASGFRSPATHRVNDWLAELPVEYDCTIPLTDPYEPQPGGCCSPWPFFIGDLVELPYTMPQDHTLFTLLRQRDISVWLSQLEALERCHGLAQCVTHPDPGYLGEPQNQRRYAEFLAAVAERQGLWRPLPREVAAWWRRRDAGEFRDGECSVGIVTRADSRDLIQIRAPG